MSGEFHSKMAENLALIEEKLGEIFAQHPQYGQIQEAMNYSLLAGGKRIRPILAVESCRLCGGRVEDALPLACAIEMVHTYSLIHDDLPAMDDDDLRRGRPTSHIVYGEATAILAGDGLLTAAFEMVATANLPPERVVVAVACLARAAGHRGMIGGQVLDLAGENSPQSLDDLVLTQSLKTGALIQAACQLGCIAAGGTAQQMAALERYSMALGRAFQIQDDILDVTSTDAELGKPIGSDVQQNKTTFATLLGLDKCHQMVDRLTEEAIAALSDFENNEFHITLAKRLATRRS